MNPQFIVTDTHVKFALCGDEELCYYSHIRRLENGYLTRKIKDHLRKKDHMARLDGLVQSAAQSGAPAT